MMFLSIKGTFILQNFTIYGLPNNTYYLYISSDSLRFPERMPTFPNERFVEKYHYFIPIKFDFCPQGGILENKTNG